MGEEVIVIIKVFRRSFLDIVLKVFKDFQV
jgi:hypothetical protein